MVRAQHTKSIYESAHARTGQVQLQRHSFEIIEKNFPIFQVLDHHKMRRVMHFNINPNCKFFENISNLFSKNATLLGPFISIKKFRQSNIDQIFLLI